MKKERQSNFELLRIVAIFFIIIWHIIVHGKIFDGLSEPYTFISNVISAFVLVHVNSLIMITGYFNGEKKEIKKSRALKYLGTGWFYNTVSLSIIIYFNLKTFTHIELMEELLLISAETYWFLNCYVILYLLIPFLNRVTEKMTEKEFFHFLLIQVFLLCFIPVLTNNRFISNSGYTIIQFIVMYYIGSFFKKYPIKNNYYFKNLSNKQLRWVFFISFIMLALARLSFYYFGEKLGMLNSSIGCYWSYNIKKAFFSYPDPLIILQTCAFFLFFETLSIKSKFINFMASSTFGIYLVHDNHNLRKILYKSLNVTRYGSSIKTLLMLLIATIIIYFGSFMIETIRKYLTKLITLLFRTIKKKQTIE